MQMNAAYLDPIDVDLPDLTRPLRVRSAGFYRLETHPVLRTFRPAGRTDYQLLYVTAGRAFFQLEDKAEDTEVSAGSMILFRPGQRQSYVYYGPDRPEVFWVHFTGNQVEQLLSESDFGEKQVFFPGICPVCRQLFQQMILELQRCRPRFEELVLNLFRQLLLYASRRMTEQQLGGNADGPGLEAAVRYFTEHYAENIVIADYAEAHNVSVSGFIHRFRQYTRMTPMQYILSLRLANAQSLLDTTDYTVTQIAALVGYENPLYFSRLFKKHLGMSPQTYRNRRRST